jgi:hypothetical protein
MKNNLTSGSTRLDQELAANVRGRKRPERLTKTMKNTDGSMMGNKVGYAIVNEEHTIKKRILPQNTVFSAEESAIIGAIQSEENSRHEIVIITDSLSTIMAAESRTPTRNPKTQTIRKMLDQKVPKIILLWVPVTKEYQERQRKKCWTKTSQPLKNTRQMTSKMVDRRGLQKKRPKMGKRKQRDERKETGRRQKEDTKGMPREEQVVISRLKTG